MSHKCLQLRITVASFPASAAEILREVVLHPPSQPLPVGRIDAQKFSLRQGLSLPLAKSKMCGLGLGIQILAITWLPSLGTSEWLFL